MHMGNDMATLERFLRTGELGPIHPGMSESEVKRVLGAPKVWTNGREPLIVYGRLQLFFRDSGASESELKDIGLSFSPSSEPNLPEGVRPIEDFECLSSQTTLEEFHDFLVRVGLSKDVKSYEGEEDMVKLIIPPPGARITFHDGKLWSVHFTDRTPPQRQISLSVSEDTWNQLRQLAQQSKRPVSAICAEWITQRAKDVAGISLGNGLKAGRDAT